MLDGVLFDYDGVIHLWDHPELFTFEPDAGFEPGTVFAVAFDPDLNRAVISGRATWHEWREETTRRLVAVHGSEVRAVAERFFDFQGRIDPEMLAVLEALRSRVNVGLLTNNHDRFELSLEAAGLHDHFDFIGNTHRLGVAKPDPRAFELALEGLGVAPERCLFTDDLAVNVDGAAAVGMHAHHFEGAEGLLTRLAAFGIDL